MRPIRLTKLLEPDEIVLRRCRKCGRYDWMQEWRVRCREHAAQSIDERQQRLRRSEVSAATEPRQVYRAKWNRPRG